MTGAEIFRARCEGRSAHHCGSPADANPHGFGEKAYLEWRTGWDQGAAEWAPTWSGSWPEDIGL